MFYNFSRVFFVPPVYSELSKFKTPLNTSKAMLCSIDSLGPLVWNLEFLFSSSAQTIGSISVFDNLDQYPNPVTFCLPNWLKSIKTQRPVGSLNIQVNGKFALSPPRRTPLLKPKTSRSVELEVTGTGKKNFPSESLPVLW